MQDKGGYPARTRTAWAGAVAALVGSGRLGSKSAHGEPRPLDNLRGDPLRLVVPLAARVALLVADPVGLCDRGLLPRNLVPLRLGVPLRGVPRVRPIARGTGNYLGLNRVADSLPGGPSWLPTGQADVQIDGPRGPAYYPAARSPRLDGRAAMSRVKLAEARCKSVRVSRAPRGLERVRSRNVQPGVTSTARTERSS